MPAVLLRGPTHDVPRPEHGARLRDEDRRQGQRGRAVAGGAAPSGGGRPHRDGHEHRPVPAGRGEVPPHPGDHRGARPSGQPVLDPHQVDAGPARPRRARSDAAAHRRSVDFSIGTLDEEVWKATEPGTPHPREAGRGGAPSSTPPASHAACWWRRSCPGCPTTPSRCAEWSPPASRPAPALSHRSCSTSAPASASSTWSGWRGRVRTCWRRTRRCTAASYPAASQIGSPGGGGSRIWSARPVARSAGDPGLATQARRPEQLPAVCERRGPGLGLWVPCRRLASSPTPRTRSPPPSGCSSSPGPVYRPSPGSRLSRL